MEELESERSRLEQEKQALEMQMERLTLQVGDGMAREMCAVQPLLLPASLNETLTSSCATHQDRCPGPSSCPWSSCFSVLSGAVAHRSHLPVAVTFTVVCFGLFLFSFLPPDHTAHGKKPTG